jgi:acyl-CoA dehydrogenase
MPIEFKRSWNDEEVESFRGSWVRFVETEMLPQDAEARRRGHVGHALWRRAGELGFLCVDIPEEWGGAGGDFRHEAVLHEEMARRALSGMSIGVHSIAAHYLLNHGTEDQKRRYLPRLAKGELIGAIAMTEPGAGSDLQAIRTRAERHGNQYAINGSKTFISNGFLAELVVVVCKTDPSERARGISLMLVETGDCAGFRVGRLHDKIGRKAQDTAELFFDEVRVPADNLLGGDEGQGFHQLMADLPYERMMIGVGALATMEGAYRATLDYVRERQAFGRPIADFQNTRFKLAEVADADHRGPSFHRPLRRTAAGRRARCGDRVDGQAVGLGDRGAGHRRAAAAPRRLRLHERIPDRPHVRRRSHRPHLRRDQRDHEGSHRARPMSRAER